MTLGVVAHRTNCLIVCLWPTARPTIHVVSRENRIAPAGEQNHPARRENAKVRDDVGARANPTGAQRDFTFPIFC